MTTQYRLRTETEIINQASGDLAGSLNNWFTRWGPSTIFKNCDNCKHMVENGPAFCALYQMTPPASVIVSGCPQHDDKEEIPF